MGAIARLGRRAAVQNVLTATPAADDIIALSKFARLEVVGDFPLDVPPKE